MTPKLYHNKRIGPHVGTVGHFNPEGQMCEPAEAILAELVTDGGSHYFFTVTPTTPDADGTKKADRKPKPKKSTRAERFVWKPGDIRIIKPGTAPRKRRTTRLKGR